MALARIDFAPVAGVMVRACDLLTCVACTTEFDAGVTDADGQVELTVHGAQACFHVDSFVPLIHWPGRPINRDGQDVFINVLTSQGEIDAISNLLGLETDLTRGHVSAVIRDCWDVEAPGVTAELTKTDEKTVRAYVDGVLSLGATETDSSGLVWFFNVPSNTDVELIAKRNGDVFARHQVIIQPGHIYTSYTRPSPR